MEDFKSSLVGKSCNLKDEIEKLPEEPRKLWINREFISFLNKFKGIISKVPTGKNQKTATSIVIRDKINPVLPFLSELGYSFDNVVHKLIHECYQDLSKLCDDLGRLPGELPRRVASSSSKYLVKILCSKRKKFCTEDFMKQHLALISGRWEEQTLKVEIEFKSHKQRDLSVSRFYGHECDLQQIALDFLDKLYIYPLSGKKFPRLPGVYLIYYVGKTQLYEGSQVSPSTDYPVYVGMSKKSISRRLNTHRKNIKRANGEQTRQEKQAAEEGQTDQEQTHREQTGDEQTDEEQTDEEQTDEEQTDEEQTDKEQTDEKEPTDEEQTQERERSEIKKTERGSQTEGVKMELSDFVVRFMIVDIKHYACCIESMLIEYFCPVWNSETVKLSFGNAGEDNNNWHKYHIEKDEDTIRNILDLLKICSP